MSTISLEEFIGSMLRLGSPLDYVPKSIKYCPYLRKDKNYYRCIHSKRGEDKYYYLEPCIEPRVKCCSLIQDEKDFQLLDSIKDLDPRES